MKMEMITIADVRKDNPKKIYYGAQTLWWTHRAGDLHSTGDLKMKVGPNKDSMKEITTSLPCDPRGGMLFETDDVEAFLKAAEGNPEHYGRHGIRAFELAHHQNCSVPFDNWEGYNDFLDKHVIFNKVRRERAKRGFCPYCNVVLGLKEKATLWFCSLCGFRMTDVFKKELEK